MQNGKPSQKQYEIILANVAKFISLTAAEKKFFCSLLQVKRVRRRQYVLQAGEVSMFENFVNNGCLRAYYIDDKGNERIVQFALEGWWIGDMASFERGTPAKLTIDAMEDSEILRISKENFHQLLERVPKFERFFRILLSHAFIAHQHRVLSHLTDSAEERYNELRTKYPGFERRIPQRHIASYLGVTPEFLSRMRRRHTRKK